MNRKEILIDSEKCIGCGQCARDCVANRFGIENGKALVMSERCIECGHCFAVCPVGAVSCGKINNKCIRCLACVEACPKNALKVSYNPFLTMYLKKAEHNDFHIYL